MLESGATSHMIKDEGLLNEIDNEYTGIITNANSSKCSIEGRGTIEIRPEDSKGCERKKRSSSALFVPHNSKNLVSLSKIRAADKEVLFGRDLEIRTRNGRIFLYEKHDSRFLLTLNPTGSRNCNLANGDQLSLWRKGLGHNNIEDL